MSKVADNLQELIDDEYGGLSTSDKYAVEQAIELITDLEQILENLKSSQRCSACYNPEDYVCPACKAINAYKALEKK